MILENKKALLWLGISLQKGTKLAFDEKFLSGKIIAEIITDLKHLDHYKSNLVNFAPLDVNNKIRYPDSKEIEAAFSELGKLIDKVKPSIIVAVGNLVAKSLAKYFKIKISKLPLFISGEKNYTVSEGFPFLLPIHHPSYVVIYKRKFLENYKKAVVAAVMKCKKV